MNYEDLNEVNEKFESMSNSLCSLSTRAFIEHAFSWDKFIADWNHSSGDLHSLEQLFESRKIWYEARLAGIDFKDFVEKKILELGKSLTPADYNSEDDQKLYQLFVGYLNLDYDVPAPFLKELLSLDFVWNNPDPSMVHSIFDFMGVRRNVENVETVLSYIKNISGDNYSRQRYLGNDIRYATTVLKSLVGDTEAKRLLETSGLGDFKSFINSDLNYFEEYSVEKFDSDLERQRLLLLEDDLVRLRSEPLKPGTEPIDLEKASVLIKRIKNLTLYEKLAHTAVPVIQLHLFNFLYKNPEASEQDLSREIDKMSKLSTRENICADESNPLPTIGIEIEISRDFLTEDIIEILDTLSVYNTEEGFDLWEVNPHFSYSAEVQARVIQELVNLGAIPVDQESGQIESDEPLSLHINFGSPANVTPEILDSFKNEMHLINDILVYAFTSLKRLVRRKTVTSLSWKRSATNSNKNKSEVKSENYTRGPVRIEMRATEFKDYTTFRMLSEAQALVAMFISHVKISKNLKTNFVDAILNDLWVKFETEASNYLEAEGLGGNQIDNVFQIDTLIEKLNASDIRDNSRNLISYFAKQVNKIAKTAMEKTG